MNRRITLACLTVALTLAAPAAMLADEPTVKIGDTVKSLKFKDIRYLPRSLEELGEHKAIVFAFLNTTCPLAQRYLPRAQVTA